MFYKSIYEWIISTNAELQNFKNNGSWHSHAVAKLKTNKWKENK